MLLSKFISSYPYNLEIDFDKQWKYLIGRPFRFPKKMFVNLIYLILSKCSNFSNWSLWETMYLMSLSMFSHVQAFYLQELLTQDKKVILKVHFLFFIEFKQRRGEKLL